MQIDFSSLSFKIEKPETEADNHLNSNISLEKIKVKQYLGFEDTQASGYQQEVTTNPFRRTFHLFKHVEMEKRNSQEKSYRAEKSPAFTKNNNANTSEINQTTFSLSNFDSFNNRDSKGDTLQSISKHLFDSKHMDNKAQPKLRQSDGSQFIKIESSYHYQNSEQFSLIMDDLNCQLRGDDLIPENSRRIKTEYLEQDIKIKKKDKKNSGIFCLTMQEESSSQSHVQQFYFDLRKEKQKIIVEEQEKQSLKKEIKSIIYSFVDDLQIMEENQIDPDFIKKVQQCLITVRKIPSLPMLKSLATPEKWDLSNRKDLVCNSRCQSFKKFETSQIKRFDKGQPSQKPIIAHMGPKNKENSTPIKNSWEETKKKTGEKNIYKVMESKLHKQQKKKKWIL